MRLCLKLGNPQVKLFRRATHDVLPFLTHADKVMVLSVNASGKVHIPGADISTHLARATAWTLRSTTARGTT